MKDHTGDQKGYVHVSATRAGAWSLSRQGQNGGLRDEVLFGFYDPDGGSSGELSMRWRSLSQAGHERSLPYLHGWNDGWHALFQFQDVLAALAEVDEEDITPQEFCRILDRCGFTDLTGERKKEEEEEARETQFAEAARSLLTRLTALVNETFEHAYTGAQVRQRRHEIVARFLYDFAAHVVTQTILHARGDMRRIPDFLEAHQEGEEVPS